MSGQLDRVALWLTILGKFVMGKFLKIGLISVSLAQEIHAAHIHVQIKAVSLALNQKRLIKIYQTVTHQPRE